MTNTFICYQVSAKETIRYEMPMALEPLIREWQEGLENAKRTGLRGYPKTIARWIAVCHPECPELFAQIKVTSKPTPLWPHREGYTPSGWQALNNTLFTHYDYPG